MNGPAGHDRRKKRGIRSVNFFILEGIMYRLKLNWPGVRPSFTIVAKIAMLAFLGLAATTGWSQPANDNFENAQPLFGNGGTTTESNVGATLEPGEPIDAGVGGGKTIWFTWTAPQSETVEFDTEGSDFDTVMGVYTGTNVSNLTLVAQNDDVSFPSDLTSRVDFPVESNMVYYISVDGNEGDSGDVTLNWSSTGDFSSGAFGFAAPDTSIDGIPVYNITPWDTSPTTRAAWMPLLNTTVRVVRTNGSAGSVLVSYNITNTYYTNYLFTNVFGTNIFVTNTDGTFSNYFSTNYYAFNFIQNYDYKSGFFYVQVTNAYALAMTNLSGFGTLPGYNNQLTASGYPFLGPCPFSTNLAPGMATNGTVISTITTNIFCTNILLTNIVPTARPGSDYFPGSGVVELHHFQMGTNIDYQVADSMFGVSTNTSPFKLVNHLVIVNLNSVTYDPVEDTNDLAPPSISQNQAYIEIVNPYAVPSTQYLYATNIQADFVKSVNWINEVEGGAPSPGPGQITARIWVRRTGTDGAASLTVNYVADQVAPPVGQMNRYDFFPLQPASDYATPTGVTPPSKSPPHFFLGTGTVSWGANDFADKPIDITVNYDPAVQFNEDVLVQLWNNNNTGIGPMNTSTLTILFNDQPAGALDRTHNQDNAPATTPPYNNAPGAGGPQNTVYAAVVQPNNQTVIAGDLQAYDTTPRNRIARMKFDGSLDTNFLASPNTGANDTITCLGLQQDGRIIIGGVFTAFNGTNRSHIARLNTDGSLDLTFNPGFGANATVWTTAVQPDGKVLVGGDFTAINDTNFNFIARLNSDGTLDTNFVPGIGPNGTVNTIALQADGKIIIGGQFTAVDTTNFNYIARLNTNGTLDT